MQDKRIQNKRILQYQELRFVGLIYIYILFSHLIVQSITDEQLNTVCADYADGLSWKFFFTQVLLDEAKHNVILT